MIKVKKENKYKVLKPELFKANEMLLGKYQLYRTNTFGDERCGFSKTFGTKDDIDDCKTQFTNEEIKHIKLLEPLTLDMFEKIEVE